MRDPLDPDHPFVVRLRARFPGFEDSYREQEDLEGPPVYSLQAVAAFAGWLQSFDASAPEHVGILRDAFALFDRELAVGPAGKVSEFGAEFAEAITESSGLDAFFGPNLLAWCARWR